MSSGLAGKKFLVVSNQKHNCDITKCLNILKLKKCDIKFWDHVAQIGDYCASSIFILTSPHCEEYRIVSSKKFLIFGPKALYEILINKLPIPDNRRDPLFYLTMCGMNVSLSAFDEEEKVILSTKVRMMGGKVMKNLIECVTHLVVKRVGSEKYFVAVEHGMKIEKDSWIDEMWIDSAKDHIDIQDLEKRNSCAIFENLSITSTGFNEHTQNEIKEIIESNGGMYKNDLSVGFTTHLICNTLNSEKYKLAQNLKNIKCVGLQWLKKCVKANRCLREEKFMNFDVEKGHKLDSSILSATDSSMNEFIDPKITLLQSLLSENKSLLENTLIDYHFCLHGFSGDDQKILQNLIYSMSGFCHDSNNSLVTHSLFSDTLYSARSSKNYDLKESMNLSSFSDFLKKHLNAKKSINSVSNDQAMGMSSTDEIKKSSHILDEQEPTLTHSFSYSNFNSNDTVKVFYKNSFQIGNLNLFFPENNKTIKNLILANQGSLIPIDSLVKDYLVSDIAAENKTEGVKYRYHVNSLYIQLCIEANKMLDINNNKLFKPIYLQRNSGLLDDINVKFYNFSKLEHDYLKQILLYIQKRDENIDNKNNEVIIITKFADIAHRAYDQLKIDWLLDSIAQSTILYKDKYKLRLSQESQKNSASPLDIQGKNINIAINLKNKSELYAKLELFGAKKFIKLTKKVDIAIVDVNNDKIVEKAKSLGIYEIHSKEWLDQLIEDRSRIQLDCSSVAEVYSNNSISNITKDTNKLTRADSRHILAENTTTNFSSIFENAKKKYKLEDSQPTNGPENSLKNHLEFQTSNTGKLIQSPDNSIKIRWVDPTELPEKSNLTDMSLDIPIEEAGKTIIPSLPPKFFFQLSGFDTTTKLQFGKFLEDEKDAVLCEDVSLHPTTSHLIIKNLKKNPRFMISVAKGLLVLHPSYIERCLESNRIIDPTDFEWNKVVETNRQNFAPLIQKMALSANYWHNSVAKLSKKPFDDWIVVVVSNSTRREDICRLLEAGGANILSRSRENIPNHVTHIIIDLNELRDYNEILKLNAPIEKILKLEFISSYLLDNGVESRHKYSLTVENFKKFYET